MAQCLVLIVDMTPAYWADAETLGRAVDGLRAARQLFLLGGGRHAAIVGVGGQGADYLAPEHGLRESPWDPAGGLAMHAALAKALCFVNRHKVTGSRPADQSVVVVSVLGSACSAEGHMPALNAAFVADSMDIRLHTCWLGSGVPDLLCQQVAAASKGTVLNLAPADPASAASELLALLLQTFVCPRVPGCLQLPPAAAVDTRASCFVTNRLLELGLVCPVCFSIFHLEFASAKACPVCETPKEIPSS
ncbi:RNA polymerase II transcription factor B subunit 4 [Diplonema papillatum]|nr:RNA polymerase II transcription factor B subunit 4 [Diplonema papillatum]